MGFSVTFKGWMEDRSEVSLWVLSDNRLTTGNLGAVARDMREQYKLTAVIVTHLYEIEEGSVDGDKRS